MARYTKTQRHSRYTTSNILFFASPDDAGRGYVRNISEGGAFVETKKSLPSGTAMQIELFLDLGDEVCSIQASAEVAWVSTVGEGRRNGMELRFTAIGEEALAELRRAISMLEAPS